MSNTVRWVIEPEVVPAAAMDAMVATLLAEGVAHSKVEIGTDGEVFGRAPRIGPGEAVVCYGSMSLARTSRAQGWLPGVWTGPELGEAAVCTALGPLSLNSDGVTCRFGDLLPERLWPESFVKPEGDTKDFAGQVIRREAFLEWRDDMLRSGYIDDAALDRDVLVAPAQRISAEWRLFVVRAVVASACCYRAGGAPVHEAGAPQDVLSFASRAIERHNPFPAFVIDVARRHDGELRVVELNAMNSASFHACDPAAIVTAVNAALVDG